MNKMQYIEIPGVARPVSRLIQGTMMASERNDRNYGIFDAALEQGINTFDTAQVYGNERVLGGWIADRGVRNQVNILTKGAHHNDVRRRVTPWDITADILDSLGRLGVDHIDIYILHRDDPDVPVGPIVEVLNEHQKAGRIGAFGGSNWTHDRIREANQYASEHNLTPFAISNPNFSVVEQVEEPWAECVSISGPSGAQARAWYSKSDVALFAWSSLAGGFLSGRVTRDKIDLPDRQVELCRRCYFSDANFERLDRIRALATQRSLTIPQVALAYILSQPGSVVAIVAPETPEEIAGNVDALNVKLTAKEVAWLDLCDTAMKIS